MTGNGLRCEVLGQLRISCDGAEIALGGIKQRTVLGVLLLHAGSPVSRHLLAETVWGDRLPAHPDNAIETYVKRLRALIEPHRLAGTRGRVLQAIDGGYRWQPGKCEIDLLEFRARRERLVQLSRQQAWEEVLEVASSAMSLWRGEPFAGLPRLDNHPHVAALRRDRQQVLLWSADAAVQLGRASEVIGWLEEAASQDPLDEAIIARLICGYHTTSRRADAFALYERTRRALAEELGIDPGKELADAHRTLLFDAPRETDNRELLDHATQLPAHSVPRPRQLPPDTSDFTGRRDERDTLFELLISRRSSDAAPPVAVISGMGGVGKTSLAVHVAHTVEKWFPDGQLYVDLRGTHADPADPHQILGQFLSALGADTSAIPDSIDERAVMYRSILADRKMLVLLDNAHRAEQVRPLRPGTAGSAVLVTSRDRLADLEGSHCLDLHRLADDEAVDMLTQISGQQRTAADPDSAGEIAVLCDHMPLAIRLAGARLAKRPHWTLRRLADALREERNRLDELDDGGIGIRASLKLSYEGLEPVPQQIFRALGLLNAPHFATWVAAAAINADMPSADEQVEILAETHLLSPVGVDPAGRTRFRFHDLVRLFARERAELEDPEQQRHLVLERMIRAWVSVARTADTSLPGRIISPVYGLTPAWPIAATVVGNESVAWFDQEREPVRAVIEQAASLGMAEEAWELADAATGFYELCEHKDDWRQTNRIALNTCQRSGNIRGEAVMTRNFAFFGLFGIIEDLPATADTAIRAAALLHHLALAEAEADAHLLHGMALQLHGNIFGAHDSVIWSLRLALGTGYPLGAVNAYHEIGELFRKEENYELAEQWLAPAADLARRHGHIRQLISITRELAIISFEQQRFQRAEAHILEALTFSRSLPSPGEEVFTLIMLGRIRAALGRDDARPLLEECLDWSRADGWEYGQASTLAALGDLESATGFDSAALTSYEQAIELATSLQMPTLEARILKSITEIHARTS